MIARVAAACADRPGALPFSLLSIALIPVPGAATTAEAATAEAAKAVARAGAGTRATAGCDAPCLADDDLIALFQAGENLGILAVAQAGCYQHRNQFAVLQFDHDSATALSAGGGRRCGRAGEERSQIRARQFAVFQRGRRERESGGWHQQGADALGGGDVDGGCHARIDVG